MDELPSTSVEGKKTAYRLEVPRAGGWLRLKEDSARKYNPLADLWLVAPDTGAPVLVIVERSEDGALSANALADVLVEQSRLKFSRYNEVSRKPLQHTVKNAVLVHSRSTLRGNHVEWLVGIFVEGKIAYQVAAFAPEERFATVAHELEGIVRSFAPPVASPVDSAVPAGASSLPVASPVDSAVPTGASCTGGCTCGPPGARDISCNGVSQSRYRAGVWRPLRPVRRRLSRDIQSRQATSAHPGLVPAPSDPRRNGPRGAGAVNRAGHRRRIGRRCDRRAELNAYRGLVPPNKALHPTSHPPSLRSPGVSANSLGRLWGPAQPGTSARRLSCLRGLPKILDRARATAVALTCGPPHALAEEDLVILKTAERTWLHDNPAKT